MRDKSYYILTVKTHWGNKQDHGFESIGTGP